MNYGLPYMGSKNLIAKTLIDALPAATTFVDLFAGGCAMTHCALTSGKFKRIIANDIGIGPKMFVDAINGKYKDEKRWISREAFHRLKDSDPYVKFCFSFGNIGKDYMYSTIIEPYKRACHYAVVFNEWADFETLCPEVSEAAKTALNGIENTKRRRMVFGSAIVKELKRMGDWNLVQNNPLYNSCHKRKSLERLQSLECLELLQSLQSLERLERLQSLQRLERLERLEVTRIDYRSVKIPAGSVVYADPPYRGTSGYVCGDFDHDAFYAWCMEQPFDVYVSEYSMPSSFHEVLAIPHRSRLSATAKNAVVERLYCNHHRQRFGQLDFLGQLFAEAV